MQRLLRILRGLSTLKCGRNYFDERWLTFLEKEGFLLPGLSFLRRPVLQGGKSIVSQARRGATNRTAE